MPWLRSFVAGAGCSATGGGGVPGSVAEEFQRLGHEQVVVLEDAAVAGVWVDADLGADRLVGYRRVAVPGAFVQAGEEGVRGSLAGRGGREEQEVLGVLALGRRLLQGGLEDGTAGSGPRVTGGWGAGPRNWPSFGCSSSVSSVHPSAWPWSSSLSTTRRSPSTCCGDGAGLLFKAALSMALTTAEPGSTAGVLAMFFVVAYLGPGLPPVLLTAATHLISGRSALIVFSAVILAVSVIAARLQAAVLRH